MGFYALAVILEVACNDCEPDGKSFPRMVFLFPLLVEFGLVWCFVGSRAARHAEVLDDLLSLLPHRSLWRGRVQFAADIMAAVFVIMMVTGEVYFR